MRTFFFFFFRIATALDSWSSLEVDAKEAGAAHNAS